MKKYIILTDSSSDLPQWYADDNNLVVIPLKVRLVNQDKEYFNYLDEREIKTHDFYELLRNGDIGKTSQTNILDYMDACKKYLEQEYDILGIGFSSGLSGTFNSMRLAFEELRELYPNRKIYAIDSLLASLGQGLLVDYACNLKKQDKSIEEVYEKVEQIKPHVCSWFTVSDIENLRRGGRISATSAFIAKNLRINPVLHVNDEGKLIARYKVIGRKKSIIRLVEKMKETFDASYGNTVFISHGDCLEDALFLEKLLKEKLNVEVSIINYVGPVIGSHSGPGTLALFFFGKER